MSPEKTVQILIGSHSSHVRRLTALINGRRNFTADTKKDTDLISRSLEHCIYIHPHCLC